MATTPLGELQEKHRSIIRSLDEHGFSQQAMSDLHQLLVDAQELGKAIVLLRNRHKLQAILNYWSGIYSNVDGFQLPAEIAPRAPLTFYVFVRED